MIMEGRELVFNTWITWNVLPYVYVRGPKGNIPYA